MTYLRTALTLLGLAGLALYVLTTVAEQVIRSST